MKKFKGTKGDWYYQENSDTYTNIVRSNAGKGRETIFITQLSQDTSGEAEANARLIAASPNLLEACIVALSVIDKDINAYNTVRKAIEKALGR